MRQTLTIADDVDNSTTMLPLLLLLLLLPLWLLMMMVLPHSLSLSLPGLTPLLGAPTRDDDALAQLGVYCVAAVAALVTLLRCAPLLDLSVSPAATM